MKRESTKGQRKAIHAAAAITFGSDDDYREWLHNNFGVHSCTNLSFSEAHQAIQILAAFTGHKSDYKHQPRQGSRVSGAQITKIKALEILLDWKENPARLDGCINRQTGKTAALEMLNKSEAKKIIIGMQRIASGKSKEVYKALNTTIFPDPGTPAGLAVIRILKKRIRNNAGD